MQPGLSISALEPGTFVDRFRIVRRLAIGGMAELYLADATGIEGFEKRLVLKRILPQYLDRPDFVGMFLDEARLAATLHHPNIGQVYDIGCDGDTYYFTMEYIEGRDVRHIRKRTLALDQDIPLEHTVAIALGVAGGLHAAHEQRGPDGSALGIVHRDVSPANVIVSWDGHVKLIDFGIAKASRRQTNTRTGILKGKACNMSPEQCLASPLDRRSDVFSLGIMLYELSTSTRLFRTESEFETMRLIVGGVYEPPSARRAEYPEGLEHVVMRALSRDPDDRYQTAHEMFVDLDCFAREQRLAVSPYHIADYLGELFPREDDAEDASSPPLFLVGDEADVSDVSVQSELRKPSESSEQVDDPGLNDSIEIDLNESVELPLERANTINFPRVEPERRSPSRRSAAAACAKDCVVRRGSESVEKSAQETPAQAEKKTRAQLDSARRADTVTLALRVDSATPARRLPSEDAGGSEPPTSLINVRDGRAPSAPIFASHLSIVALCGSLALAAAVLVFGIFADDGWFAGLGSAESSAPEVQPIAARGGDATASAVRVAPSPSAPGPEGSASVAELPVLVVPAVPQPDVTPIDPATEPAASAPKLNAPASPEALALEAARAMTASDERASRKSEARSRKRRRKSRSSKARRASVATPRSPAVRTAEAGSPTAAASPRQPAASAPAPAIEKPARAAKKKAGKNAVRRPDSKPARSRPAAAARTPGLLDD